MRALNESRADLETAKLRRVDAMLAKVDLKAPPMELIEEEGSTEVLPPERRPNALRECLYCTRPVMAKSLCRGHYERTRRQARAINAGLKLGGAVDLARTLYLQDVAMIADQLQARFRAGDFTAIEGDPEAWPDGSSPGLEKFIDLERQFFEGPGPFADDRIIALILAASKWSENEVVAGRNDSPGMAAVCISLDIYFLAKARGWLPPVPAGAWTPEEDYGQPELAQ